jgi:hypothetical protein
MRDKREKTHRRLVFRLAYLSDLYVALSSMDGDTEGRHAAQYIAGWVAITCCPIISMLVERYLDGYIVD